ncbi:MRX complex DNA-binding subunit Ecym_1108 [Eremothecium cymbalariae DBVPG|uniref:DNA repair protein RAD50 n=1 Tax=Eremothecium cymbalariae (strain CBS 270.75 / DBVPG 7215 / KCTC 17166 / NRRL Y-17582) TaxID=931890 RepID=G8JMK8_ERECY|nr:hypothetical protein Ecym_1108 [Eremothecium cymbalariae DBVPG\
MSAIHNLSIQGIRSFDARDKEVIKFGKPLTLIVGANGCGKTTIIECLKYATTGDLPPNSKNGAFIHDPKINGEVDVRAQVKLAFTNANGVQMVVTRNIQLMKKRSTATFKTLEGQLVSINKGERTTLSTRAADLDQQVPLYLGVPKAILDYVIFCHQEDSLWPLSEPANLKKRFDEIFQAMKFTKALDNLKSIKKDMAVDIRLLKQSVEHLKTDRDRSRAIALSISELEDKTESYKATLPVLEAQLKDITEQSDKLFKSNQEFQQVLSKLDNLKHSRESVANQIKRLEESIEPLDMSRDELQQLLDNFSSAVDEKRDVVSKLEDDLSNVDEKLQRLRGIRESMISEHAVLSSNKEKYVNNLKLHEELSAKLVAKYKFSGVDILHDMKLLVLDTEKAVSKAREDNRLREEGCQDLLAKKRNTLVKEEQKLSYTESDATKLKEQLDALNVRLTSIEQTESDLKVSKEDLEKYKSLVDTWRQDKNFEQFNKDIKAKNDEMLILEHEVENVQNQISKTNQHSDLLAKYSMLKSSIQDKKKELDSSILKIEGDKSSQLLGMEVTDDFELDLKKNYINLQKQIASSSRSNREASAKCTEFQIELRSAEKELNQLNKKVLDLREKLANELPEDCSIDEYDEVLLESEESYRVSLENLKMHRTTLEFNLKALEIAENDHCCYLCQRKFQNDVEKANLLEELHSKTKSDFEQTLIKEVQDQKEYYFSLRKLEKDIIALREVESKVKLAQENVSQWKVVHHNSKLNMELADSEHNRLKEAQDHFERTLKPIVNDVIRLRKELNQSEADCSRIEEELSIYSEHSNGVQTIDEFQLKQKNINGRLRLLRKEIGKLQEEKENSSTEYNNLLNLVREKTFKVNYIEKKLEEKRHIQKDIDDIASKYGNVDSVVLEIQKIIDGLNSEIGVLEKSLEEVRIENRKLEQQQDLNLTELKSNFGVFNSIVEEIKAFEIDGIKKLEDVESSLQDCNEEIDTLSHKVNELNQKIISESQKLKDSTSEQKNMKLNIDLIDLKGRLAQIGEHILNLDSQNAEAERDRYQQESTRLRFMFEKLSSENAGKLGEIKQLQNQISSLTKQLQTEYKDVDINYQNEWARLQTKTLVADDIDTYSKVLDSAIMKYHRLKMEDINRIIDELWKRTYSGTDVDTIKIKSDELSNNNKGKSYNYRVVMYKQDAELDMRGRCSAGQKVLASIIIRLALSETFGINCGVIALDEPTTNLDEDNIASLARSLSNILEVRRHQKNFQLIVITHDEKFLSHMNAVNFTDHFWKVKRDDRQKSEILMVDIATAKE